MIAVGIETSGLSGGIALLRDGECLEERSLQQPGRRHAQALVLELHEALKAHNLTPRAVTAVAVSRGPGSFTGLRVGMVCAKTFAYATGCQYVAVDTFAAMAMNCREDVQSVWTVEDAQRGDLFVGHYQRTQDGFWEATRPVAIAEGESWLAGRAAGDVVIGRGLARMDLTMTQARCLADDKISHPSAVAVARLAQHRLQTRNPSDAENPEFDFWSSIPFYIRPSAAEETREKKLAKL